MPRFDRETGEKTIIAPRRKAGGQVAPPIASFVRKPPTLPIKPRQSSWPVVVFGLMALLLLGATATLVTIHVLTGGRTEFSDAVLNSDLVAVEASLGTELQTGADADADIEKYLPPKIIDLSGDPVVIIRRGGVLRQLIKLADTAVSNARSLGVDGEIYRMDENLLAADLNLLGGLPGSQQDFAFFQSADEVQAPGAESDNASAQQEENTSVVEVNSDGGKEIAVRQEFIAKLEQDQTLKQALAIQGFDEVRAEAVEKVFEEEFQIRTLATGDYIALRGIVAEDNGTKLIPVQISVYRNETLIGTLALSELDSYVSGADPWFGENIFEETDEALVGTGKQRLLDAIYSAAVRNNVPTSVTGETILLLSRANDLEQAAAYGDSITILFTTVARDRKSGFGRVLYVRIQRTTGNIECFAFQASAGKQFDCISGDGRGAETDGMVTPVKGVIVTKFGPVKDSATGKKRMNFGVDWTAPLGTSVVAAFAGEVTFAGNTADQGNVVRITHANRNTTSYAHLQRLAPSLSQGSRVAAGQPIGYVGQTGNASQPLMHFELISNGKPVDPFGEYQRAVEKGGSVDSFVNRIIHVESANNCNARNPLSTAVGLGQFIESTWINTIKSHRPDLFEKKSRAQVLELRVECDLAREMTIAFTRDNASVIRAQGHDVTPGNLYLAHFLGVGGALKALGGNPEALIIEVFGPKHVQANPFEAGKSLRWLIEWAARKMEQKVPVEVAQSAAFKPQNKVAGTKAFANLKSAIEVMLR